MLHFRFFPVLLAALLLACPHAPAADPVNLPFQLIDLQGKVHNLASPEAKTRVFIFLTTECPIANGNIPTLNALHQEFTANSKIDFFAVLSDPFTTRRDATANYRDFKATFPVLFDSSNQLRDRLKPTHVPEAFVLDPAGLLLYRGAIDNAWESPGKRRQVVTARYLADTLAALREGKPVPQPRAKPVGCPVEYTPSNTPVSYTRDLAPVLHARCASCHAPKGTSFDLTSFKTVTAKSAQLLANPCKGPPDPQKPLNPAETALLKKWAESGQTQGDPADWPPAPSP
jgi:hypothetical protein